MIVRMLEWLGLAHAATIAGDLHEERALVAGEVGRWGAMRWYGWQVSRLLARSMAIHGALLFLAMAPLHLAWAALFDFLCLLPPAGLSPVNAAGVFAGALLGRRAVWFVLVPVVFGAGAFPYAMAMALALPAGLLAARLGKGMV